MSTKIILPKKALRGPSRIITKRKSFDEEDAELGTYSSIRIGPLPEPPTNAEDRRVMQEEIHADKAVTSHSSRGTTANLNFELAIEIIKKTNSVFLKGDQSKDPDDVIKFTEDFKKIADWYKLTELIRQYSAENGLTLDEVRHVWKLASFPLLPLQQQNTINLLKSMLPREPLNEDLVEEIFYWLLRKSENTLPKVVNTVIMLFVAWLEYGILNNAFFSRPSNYRSLLAFCRKREDVLQWLSVLIIKATKKELINQCNVFSIIHLLNQDIPSHQRKYLIDLIWKFKLMRPELIPTGTIVIVVKNFDQRPKEISKKLRKRLFSVHNGFLSRIESSIQTGESVETQRHFDNNIVDIIPLVPDSDNSYEMFFPEWCPRQSVIQQCLNQRSKKEELLSMLRSREKIPLIARDPDAVEIFNNWLPLLFHHRFSSYNVEYHHRYEFILDRCIELSILLDHDLPEVTDWLLNFFVDWDGTLFRSKILKLFTFMSITEFSGGYRYVLEKCEFHFLYWSTKNRLEMWNMFEALFMRWVKILHDQKSSESAEHPEIKLGTTALKRLFDFMYFLVNKFAIVDGHKEEVIITSMCETFEKFVVVYMQKKISFEPFPPPTLARLVILCDKLYSFEACSKLYIALSSKDLSIFSPTQDDSENDAEIFRNEIAHFLALNSSLSCPVSTLFKVEISAQKPSKYPDLHDGWTTNIKDTLKYLNCFYCRALQPYRVLMSGENHRAPINFIEEGKFQWQLLKQHAPSFYRLIGKHTVKLVKNN